MKYYKTDNRADYSEMFESTDEFSSSKIPRGTSVVLVGEKIRPALEGEVPFGVISSFPIMIGNSGGMEWSGKYLKDEFGSFVFEEQEMWVLFKDKKRISGISSLNKPPVGAIIRKKNLPKLNPEYDPKKTYIPRMDRNEWNMVALIGKVKIIKGQPVDPRWIKMKEISENVDEWLIR